MYDTGGVRAKVIAGEVTFGGWLSTNSIACAEIMARAGFDWIGIDVEHTGATVVDVENIVKAIKLRGAKPLARVFDSSAVSIRRLLDAGAEGVIVPMIRTLDEARRAVAAAKFPPLGMRGAGAGAASVYGAELADYLAAANDATLVMLMVETREAVENIDALLSVEGVDGVFLGPYDLSASYGLMGQIAAPVVQDAMDRVFAACRERGKARGVHILDNDPEFIRRTIGKGATFAALSYDAALVYRGSRDILACARGVGADMTP